MISKKGDGSQVKESTDSSTTLEDDDVKGKALQSYHIRSLCSTHALPCIDDSENRKSREN